MASSFCPFAMICARALGQPERPVESFLVTKVSIGPGPGRVGVAGVSIG